MTTTATDTVVTPEIVTAHGLRLGPLGTDGLAFASFNVPPNLPVALGFTFHHAYVVYDASGKFYMASNAVPLRLQ